MKNEISVYIPEPCHENWNNMLPADKGRFCNACAKQVIDFSMMSDTQIIDYFKNSTGRVCGRFTEDQLQRSLQPVTQPKKKAWWMAMTMPLLFLFNKSQAQQCKIVGDTTIALSEIKITEVLGKIAVRSINDSDLKKDKIIGKIVDTDGNPVPFGRILSQKTGISINNQPSGYFEFETNEFYFDDTLNFAAINYESIDIPVMQLKNNPENIITLNKMASGGVMPVMRVTRKEKVDSSVKRIAGKSLFSLSSNPAIRGSQINIQLKQSGEYSLLLLDNSSRLILSKIINSQDGNNIPLDIPNNIAAGIYYLRAIDEKSKKSFVQKIIIQ